MERSIEPHSSDPTVLSVELPRAPGEQSFRLQRAPGIEGVSFWTLSDAERDWSVLDDAYSAWLVLGKNALHWQTRAEKRTAPAGSVLWLQPGEAHRLSPVTQSASFFVVWWQPFAFESATSRIGRQGALLGDWPPCGEDERTAAFQSLYAAVNDRARTTVVDLRLQSATAALLDGLSNTKRPKAAPSHPAVRRTLELLTAHYDQPLSLASLAEQARLSKYHFARLFRDATGFAPHQYQMLLRLAAARRALERGVSVEEAAERNGFADGPHLARTFRERYGVSPGAWARAHRSILGQSKSGRRRRSTPTPARDRPLRESGFRLADPAADELPQVQPQVAR